MTTPAPAKFVQKLERFAARSSFSAWVPATLLAGSLLMTGHWLTLPMPSLREPQLQAGIAELQRASSPDRWFVLHVMYAECRCSEQVLSQLLGRMPLPGVDEWVLLVGRNERAERELSSHGYHFRTTTEAELRHRYAIRAAPLLVVANPEGWVRYVGGYTDNEHGPAIQDVRIISALRSGKKVTPMALFGCPLQHALQQSVDPRARIRLPRNDFRAVS